MSEYPPLESQARVASASRLLTCEDVIEVTSLSRSTIYRLVAKNGFPRPLRLSPGRVGWTQADLDSWFVARSKGGGNG